MIYAIFIIGILLIILLIILLYYTIYNVDECDVSYDEDIYVCVTTIPTRVNTYLKNMIDSMMKQSYHIKKFYIFIPPISKRLGKYPSCEWYDEKYAKKVEIVNIDEDYGPATKYIGPVISKVFEDKGNPLIYVGDDDQQYKSGLIYTMMKTVQKYETKCDSPIFYQNDNIFNRHIVRGYPGNMFRYSVIKNILNYPHPPGCFHTDDQWMEEYLRHENIKVKGTNIKFLWDAVKNFPNGYTYNLPADGLNICGRNRNVDINICKTQIKAELNKIDQ